MAKAPSQTRYAGNKKPVNVTIDGEVADIGKEYFQNTRFGSLSGFVEWALKKEFVRCAPKMRKAGIRLPNQVFVK